MDTSLRAINAKIVETLNSVNAQWSEEAREASEIARERMGWPGLSKTWNRGSRKSSRKKATAKTAAENAKDEIDALSNMPQGTSSSDPARAEWNDQFAKALDAIDDIDNVEEREAAKDALRDMENVSGIENFIDPRTGNELSESRNWNDEDMGDGDPEFQKMEQDFSDRVIPNERSRKNAMTELEALDQIRMDALESGSLDQNAWDAQRDRTNEAIRNIEDQDARDEAWDLMRNIGRDFRGGDTDGNPDFQEQERLSMMDNTDSDLLDPGFEERFQQMMKDRYAKKEKREYTQEEINDIIDRANAISDPYRWVDESQDEDFRESAAERNEREQIERDFRGGDNDPEFQRQEQKAIEEQGRSRQEAIEEQIAREESNRQSFEEVAEPGEIEKLSMQDLEEFEILADNPGTKQKFADERAKRQDALSDKTQTDADIIASNPATLKELSVYEIAEFITESDNPATRKALTDELDRRVAETNP